MAQFDQVRHTTIVLDDKELSLIQIALATLIDEGDFAMDRQQARFLQDDLDSFLGGMSANED